jgi:hypothetical protein
MLFSHGVKDYPFSVEAKLGQGRAVSLPSRIALACSSADKSTPGLPSTQPPFQLVSVPFPGSKAVGV